VYGDWFEGGPSVGQPLMTFSEMMDKEIITIHKDKPPVFNVFCMTAPECYGLSNKPVQMSNIEDLFKTCYTAYSLIKENSRNTPTILAGYWGAGIFMNHPRVVTIVQLTTAQMVGVNIRFHDFPAKFYPGHFQASKEYFDKEISPKVASGCNVGDILDQFFKHTQKEGWKYSKTNPVPNAT
jgi:hypothetical protein